MSTDSAPKKCNSRKIRAKFMADILQISATRLAAMVALTMLLSSPCTAIRGGGSSPAIKGGGGLSPVVLVPGTGGTRLEARLTKNYKAGSFWCYSFSSLYFRLWLDAFSLIPPFTKCFAERMKLVYNNDTERFENFPGVETRVPYWGGTEGMETLDPTWGSFTTYMGALVHALKSEGYVVGDTLFGAPYDFRYAPGPYAADVMVKYAKDIKDLIENTYDHNENKSVVLVAHSLGGLVALYFLNQQPLSWREKYIKSLVTIAAPWGGTVQEMLTFASGSTEGIAILDPLTIRDEQRSAESNLWLLPTPRVFGSRPLVLTNSKMYSCMRMEEFFEDIGYPEGVKAYRTRIPPLVDNLTAPGVPVSMLFSHGVKTAERLFYQDSFDKQPAVMEGDGDGTVNLMSLESVVADWQAVEGQQLRVTRVEGCSHSSILTDSSSLKYIVKEILFDWTDVGSAN